ncbi:helix-turn-helix transcriptional regulator [Saccharopolyspora sp. ASAGF58]|uniref:helix-turn-helix domain-containing protein n=1 Tax=Saccharopolyspora sp. ASAGF58 TaxID=2719023 RepID=UPI00143FE368|nr:helix-turn-helix transcriptional regulator [Saccharopolyspora sp. ASAGF58]QIZ34739.1 helix-turn-helix domain-containing protein [Saccharopolyspora sp. ASAGF58]
MVSTKGGSPRLRALGAELREYREQAGLTVRAVAQRLGGHHSKYARIETGERAPSPEEVAAILATYGASEDERDRLAEMARDADRPDWLSTSTSGVRKELTTLIEFERTATRITDVATGVIPGLLQTSDYARAIMQGLPPGEVEKMVLMRVGRREILTSKNAPDFVGILAEAALNELIGGRDVMVEQLRHLVKMSEWPNVDILVLRSGATRWHPAHMGSFIVFEFPKASPIVHMEHYRSSVSLHNSGIANAYKDAVISLHELAMTPEASVEFIARRADELEAAA